MYRLILALAVLLVVGACAAPTEPDDHPSTPRLDGSGWFGSGHRDTPPDSTPPSPAPNRMDGSAANAATPGEDLGVLEDDN
jgi:hypothetical protein